MIQTGQLEFSQFLCVLNFQVYLNADSPVEVALVASCFYLRGPSRIVFLRNIYKTRMKSPENHGDSD